MPSQSVKQEINQNGSSPAPDLKASVLSGSRKYLIILLVFCILWISLNLYWLSKNNSPPVLSTLVYIIMSQEFYGNLIDGDFFSFLVNTGNFYPPLPFQITSCFFFLFGPGIAQAVMSHSIFLLILVFSTYFLGKEIWNEKIGFWSALLGAVIPQTAYFSRQVGVDMPIAAMLPLCLLALFKSRRLKDSRWTVAFFIFLGIGMLLKWVFIAFVILPFILYIFPVIREKFIARETRGETVVSILATVGFILAYVFGLIYLHSGVFARNWAGVVETIWFLFVLIMGLLYLLFTFKIKLKSEEIKNVIRGITLLLGITAHFVIIHLIPIREIYRTWFWEVQYNLLLPVRTPWHFFVIFMIFLNFGVPFFVLLILSFIDYLAGGPRKFEANLLLISFFSSIAFLYTQPVYDARYYIPLNSIAALFIIAALMKIKIKPVKIILSSFLIGAGLFYFAGWLIVPDSLSLRYKGIGRVTVKPDTGINNFDKAADNFLETYRREKPGKGLLIVAKDDSASEEVTPLLILYYLRKHRTIDEIVAMLYRGSDPIFPEKKEAWGFFIAEEEENNDNEGDDKRDGFYSKDVEAKKGAQKETAGKGTYNRLESSEINQVEADSYLLVRFRNTDEKESFPEELLRNLSRRASAEEFALTESIRVRKDVTLDVYNMKN